MPAFALFFPVPVAVAATAIVHLANNLFKVVLVGRKADWSVVVRFAAPAAVAALAGAALLTALAGAPPLYTYTISGAPREITIVKVVIGVIIIVFAFFDLLPALRDLAFDRKYLPMGGLLSGFFGGLSGNQGALRSAFLIKTGLSKEAFIGTNTVSAVIVDFTRLLVYGVSFYALRFQLIDSEIGGLVAVATLSAFAGSFLGSRMVMKVTLHTVQIVVGVMLIGVGVGMVFGML